MRRLVVLLLALCATFGAAPAAAAERAAPWESAEQVRRALFDAQTELILGTPAAAAREAARARTAYRGTLRSGLREADPAADRAARAALAQATAAAQADDATALAAARGAVRAALFRGAFAVTVAAAQRGDAEQARTWLLLREFRTATRFTRPDANGTLAVEGLSRRRTQPALAAQAVTKDLLDAYQARLRELLADADQAGERGFATRRAESTAQAAGYWAILERRYRQERGAAAAREAGGAFAGLARAGRDGAEPAYADARARIDRALDGFTAAPLTPEESARRAQQLLRFLALVPVEYDRGVKDDRVTLDFEIQEAIAFRSGAAAAFADLEGQLARRDRARTEAVGADVERLGAIVTQAGERTEGVTPAEDVEALTARAERGLAATMPQEWQEPTDESDYDLIALTLDRLEAAVGAGQYPQAEQARLEAYAFFEFGPERRLRSFNPGLTQDVEGLIWFGAGDQDGLAKLIAERAPRREVRETRLALDEKLADSAATLGDSANKATVVTNAAIIVFREGLEAVLILAAITASFAGARRRMRRPVLIGAGLGLLVSRHHLGARPDAAALARALRREARGGGRAHRHRRAAADHQLVLPQGLLDGLDLALPQAAQEARGGAGVRLLLRPGARPRPARAHERLPRGLRDGALPAVAGALGRDADGGRGRVAGARADARWWPWPPSPCSASCPTRRC